MFSSIFSYDKQLFVSLQSFNELVYTSYYRWQILWTVSQASRQTQNGGWNQFKLNFIPTPDVSLYFVILINLMINQRKILIFNNKNRQYGKISIFLS